MTRLSAHKRLRELPEVFTTTTLAATLGGDSKAASVYLNRWRKEGMISSLGPRAGVHFNLLIRPDADHDLRMEAIAFVFPGAMVAGVSSVHAAGWTTQIPSALELMIPARRSFPELTDTVIETRSESWFDAARGEIVREGPVPMVSPAFALADLWDSGGWRPDPDDIEWDLADLGKLELAFAGFGLQVPDEWREEAQYHQGCAGPV